MDFYALNVFYLAWDSSVYTDQAAEQSIYTASMTDTPVATLSDPSNDGSERTVTSSALDLFIPSSSLTENDPYVYLFTVGLIATTSGT